MTIIQPNRRSIHFSLFVIALIVCGFFLLLLNIFTYNNGVELRYQIEEAKASVRVLEAENAELKNEMYKMLDFQSLGHLVNDLGLVREQSPEFFLARQ